MLDGLFNKVSALVPMFKGVFSFVRVEKRDIPLYEVEVQAQLKGDTGIKSVEAQKRNCHVFSIEDIHK